MLEVLSSSRLQHKRVMSLMRYITRKFSIPKFRLTHILPTTHSFNSRRSSRTFRQHRLYRADQLPPKVDLRPDMTPMEDQSNLGGSAANCLAGAYEYLTKKSNGCNTDISRLFIYYNARIKGIDAGVITDSGCSVSDAIEALEEFGTCLESIWPYDISLVNTRPDDVAYEQADSHKINEALQINIDLNEMKSCVAQGFPFAFGLRVYPSFDKAAKNGIVPIPSVWEEDQPSTGNHALLAVGYSDRSNAFIVRNSWGENWGDKGYCYIPYEYMTNPYHCFDAWIIRKVANKDFGREYWHFDDIVNYLNDDCIDDNDEECLTDNENSTSWRDYYYGRRGVMDDSWNEYRQYKRGTSQYDDDYFNDRYQRNRYDRDNDPYDQRYGGYTNNGFSSPRNFSSSLFTRYQNEDDYYNDSGHNRFANNHQNFMF